jgi:hypothetical protein
LWFERQVVADRADKIRLENERQAQQEQDRKRRKEEEEELSKHREQADAERREAREAELRAQHGPQARARAEEIASAIKLLVDDKETWANSEFPELATWYRNRTADGWEFVAIDQQVTDYGTADWKGRPLDVVFTDISISMKNRLLGEKKTSCFSLGLIFDAEFQMYREPLEAECENAAEPSRVWKQGRGFQSQWVAE